REHLAIRREGHAPGVALVALEREVSRARFEIKEIDDPVVTRRSQSLAIRAERECPNPGRPEAEGAALAPFKVDHGEERLLLVPETPDTERLAVRREDEAAHPAGVRKALLAD